MAVWDITVPADTLAANTLHTLIQNAKVDTMDRMETNDGTIDTHSFRNAGATGRHPVSQVGMAKAHNTYNDLLTWVGANNPPDGSVHVELDTPAVYIIESLTPLLASTLDHGELLNLDDSAVHTQYMKVDGSRNATGDWTMTASGQISVYKDPVSSSDIMLATHATSSWYDAHGASSLNSRHFADDSIGLSGLQYGIASGSGSSVISIPMFTSTQLFSGAISCACTASSASDADLYVEYSSGATRYTYSFSSGNTSYSFGFFSSTGSVLVS